MAPSKIKSLCITLLIFCAGFLFAPVLYSEDAGFFVEFTPRFIQRLTWTASQGAMRYEILIERNENEQFRRVLQEFSAEPYLEVSLPPGTYRYRVIPYDFLNRPGPESEWGALEIQAALSPQLNDFSPRVINISDMEDEYTLNIYGSNINTGAQFVLRRLGSGQVINPVQTQVLQEGVEAIIVLNRNYLTTGIYQIFVRNPSGLEANIDYLTVTNTRVVEESDVQTGFIDDAFDISVVTPPTHRESRLEWYIGAALIPFCQINENNELLTDNFSPLDMAAQIGIVSNAQNFINVGMELTTTLYSLDDPKSFLIENNLLLQKLFLNDKIGFAVRAGIGLILPLASELAGEAEELNPMDKIAIFSNVGLSVIWLPFRHFYAEVGVNYSYIFIMEAPASAVRPWIGLGVRF